MKVRDTELPGVRLIDQVSFRDDRGVLTRLLDERAFADAGISMAPRQIVHSGTQRRNTLRGLHCQRAPYTEAKLIAPLTGRTYWVVVDVRRDSAHFGKWQGFDLSGKDAVALYVPRGFAHGSVTLEDGANLAIVADNHYEESHGVGIVWNDPELAIDWPTGDVRPFMSAAHAAYGSFAEFRRRYGGL